MKVKILLTCLFTAIITTALLAQQGVVAAGGDASGTGGSASYTIGQIDYLTANGTNAKIIQGMQQPFEISEVTGTDITGIKLISEIYPNPTQGQLTLKIESENLENPTFIIYDELGKVLVNKRTEGPETIINLSNYPDAKYFIKVNNNDQELKTFQIIKLY